MKVISDSTWSRRGFSLLWSSATLAKFAQPAQVTSLRQLFQIAKDWPETLPSCRGDALFVAGLEAVLDSLEPEQGEAWLRQSLAPVLLDFQSHYDSDAALIFWIAGGAQRLKVLSATSEIQWNYSPPRPLAMLSLGRALWSGSESEARRILNPDEKNQDIDGPAWTGLYLARLS